MQLMWELIDERGPRVPNWNVDHWKRCPNLHAQTTLRRICAAELWLPAFSMGLTEAASAATSASASFHLVGFLWVESSGTPTPLPGTAPRSKKMDPDPTPPGQKGALSQYLGNLAEDLRPSRMDLTSISAAGRRGSKLR